MNTAPEVQPAPLPAIYVSPKVDIGAFQTDAAATFASLRAAVPERGSAEEDAAALSLDALPVPRLAAAVRALLDRATHSPALPAATPAQTAALRESHAAALKAAPLAALRDLSSEITTAYKDMKGARSKAVLGKRRPRNADDWAVDVLAAQPAPAAAEDNDAPPATLPVGTALVRVSMYGFTIPGVRTDDALLQTVLLPADSTLETLRDALQPGCVAERRAARFGCHGCGAFFYFEGCVYTDNRNGAVDLSAPLRAFAGDLLVTGEGAAAQATEEDPSAGSGFLPPTPSFAGGPVAKGRVDARGWSVADMAATRLFDLKVHVGKRYLFAHQGTCEHTIRIDDVRLLSSTDAQLASAYPRTTFRLERVRRKCAICDTSAATRVVYRSRLAPESPCLFCDECYQRLHYDAAGSLLFSDFEVYSLVD